MTQAPLTSAGQPSPEVSADPVGLGAEEDLGSLLVDLGLSIPVGAQ